MKNEFFVLGDDGKAAPCLILKDDSTEPRDFRSEGQADSEGRRQVNSGAIVKFRVLKTVSEQS